jgi:hypothetical protein
MYYILSIFRGEIKYYYGEELLTGGGRILMRT